MRAIDIHKAKTHFSRLVREVAEGEVFVIAVDGKPVAKVVAVAGPASGKSRTGFIKDDIQIPADFDRLAGEEIERLFYGDA